MIKMTPSRRSFITGLSALIAAPAIVRVSSLMPVRGIVMPAMPVPEVWAYFERRFVWVEGPSTVHFSDVGAPRPWNLLLLAN